MVTDRHQPNRLPPSEDARMLSGRLIDRASPLTFRLNGRTIHGHAGDTVLSAVFASGIVEAGSLRGQPLALDDRFAPSIVPRHQRRNRSLAVPMDRTPAIAGAEYVTLGPRPRDTTNAIELITRLLPNRSRSLGHEYAGHGDLAGSWHDATPEIRMTADLLVIGGGIAGMRAALVPSRAGERVILVERRQALGGDVRYFGSMDEEEAPQDLIGSLANKIASRPSITVLTRSEAIAIYGKQVRVHLVEEEDGAAVGRLIAIDAKRIVLATGSFERLPVFPGNRVPGVMRSLAAFHFADQFGVWLGRRALLSTASSYAYRLAIQAQAAGIEVSRIYDTRPSPQSRFIDFSKASGIPLTFGFIPHSVVPERRGAIEAQLAPEGKSLSPISPTTIDQLVVCGGFQPDLSLWHMAGGKSRWVPLAHRMEPIGELDGIAIAGAAAGFRSNTACMQSAARAVARLLGRKVDPVDDRQIDPMFETPDDPAPIGPEPSPDSMAAFLDSGISLAARPPARETPRGIKGWLRPPHHWRLTESRALGMGDIAAGVQLGVISPVDAGAIAQERCVGSGDITHLGIALPPPPAEEARRSNYPPYLEGRFGPKPMRWRIAAADNRDFETGCLIYPDADRADPGSAIGVVLGPATTGDDGVVALLMREGRSANEAVIVRDISGPVPARLVALVR
jgi:sarcosine oxidase subunit alpha